MASDSATSTAAKRGRPTTLAATVDFDTPGKQTGFIHVPFSSHDDAWGVIPIPIAVISNGRGPTVLLEGGNHGDEYEGPIALGEIIRDLDPGLVSGRLIIIPAINLPAVKAGLRTSPIDDLNFNRTFPCDPNGAPTQQISAYVNDVLFPMADAFLDLHSGGSSLAIIPSAIIEPVDDPRHQERNVAAVRAFGAPMIVAIDNRGDTRTATSAGARASLHFARRARLCARDRRRRVRALPRQRRRSARRPTGGTHPQSRQSCPAAGGADVPVRRRALRTAPARPGQARQLLPRCRTAGLEDNSNRQRRNDQEERSEQDQ